MNPPKIHQWASRLQLIATLFIIGAAINALFSEHITYTYIAATIALLLSIAAWIVHERQKRRVARYQEAAMQIISINRGVEQERNGQ